MTRFDGYTVHIFSPFFVGNKNANISKIKGRGNNFSNFSNQNKFQLNEVKLKLISLSQFTKTRQQQFKFSYKIL